jgi:hypothetical protein
MYGGWIRARHAIAAFAALGFLLHGGTVAAHPGGLAADSCHRDSRTGTRHCHRAPGRPAPPADHPQRLAGDRVHYANCSAARAAGAAPVREGAPGY